MPSPASVEFHPRLAAEVDEIVANVPSIDAERVEQLDRLATYIRSRHAADKPARLTFICTHNSRRSHMSQLWAAAAAAYFGIDDVETFSGGTEATAFNPRAVASLKRSGFVIDVLEPGDNPRYGVSFAPSGPVLEAFSKTFDTAPNPTEGFAAIMTCSQADASCPFVPGAEFRIAIPYEDPKASDGSEAEAATYDARSRQIATEMFYLFSVAAEADNPAV